MRRHRHHTLGSLGTRHEETVSSGTGVPCLAEREGQHMGCMLPDLVGEGAPSAPRQVLPGGKPRACQERALSVGVLSFNEEQGDEVTSESLFASTCEISHHKCSGYFLWAEDASQKIRWVRYKLISLLRSLHEGENLSRKYSP